MENQIALADQAHKTGQVTRQADLASPHCKLLWAANVRLVWDSFDRAERVYEKAPASTETSNAKTYAVDLVETPETAAVEESINGEVERLAAQYDEVWQDNALAAYLDLRLDKIRADSAEASIQDVGAAAFVLSTRSIIQLHDDSVANPGNQGMNFVLLRKAVDVIYHSLSRSDLIYPALLQSVINSVEEMDLGDALIPLGDDGLGGDRGFVKAVDDVLARAQEMGLVSSVDATVSEEADDEVFVGYSQLAEWPREQLTTDFVDTEYFRKLELNAESLAKQQLVLGELRDSGRFPSDFRLIIAPPQTIPSVNEVDGYLELDLVTLLTLSKPALLLFSRQVGNTHHYLTDLSPQLQEIRDGLQATDDLIRAKTPIPVADFAAHRTAITEFGMRKNVADAALSGAVLHDVDDKTVSEETVGWLAAIGHNADEGWFGSASVSAILSVAPYFNSGLVENTYDGWKKFGINPDYLIDREIDPETPLFETPLENEKLVRLLSRSQQLADIVSAEDAALTADQSADLKAQRGALLDAIWDEFVEPEARPDLDRRQKNEAAFYKEEEQEEEEPETPPDPVDEAVLAAEAVPGSHDTPEPINEAVVAAEGVNTDEAIATVPDAVVVPEHVEREDAAIEDMSALPNALVGPAQDSVQDGEVVPPVSSEAETEAAIDAEQVRESEEALQAEASPASVGEDTRSESEKAAAARNEAFRKLWAAKVDEDVDVKFTDSILTAYRPQLPWEGAAEAAEESRAKMRVRLKKSGVTLGDLANSDDSTGTNWGKRSKGPGGFGDGGHTITLIGDWVDSYENTLAAYEGEIQIARQAYSDLRNEQIAEAANLGAGHTLIAPNPGEVFDAAKAITTTQKIVSGTSIKMEDLETMRLQSGDDVELTTPIVYDIGDGSGSMGRHGKGAWTSMGSLMQSWCIDGRARELEGIHSGGIAFGPYNAPIVYQPDTPLNERGQRLVSLGQGLASGTNLAPAFVRIATELYRATELPMFQKGLPPAILRIWSDGDINDGGETIDALKLLMKVLNDRVHLIPIIVTKDSGAAMIKAMRQVREEFPEHVGDTIIAHDPQILISEVSHATVNQLRKNGGYFAEPMPIRKDDLGQLTRDLADKLGVCRVFQKELALV